MDTNEIENVTIKDLKPKNPNRVAWGKKLGKMKKRNVEEKETTENNFLNPSIIVGTLIIVGGIGIYLYTKSEKPIEIKSKRSLNLNL